MSHPTFASRPYVLNGLRVARTARTRIFAAGSDPYFGYSRFSRDLPSTPVGSTGTAAADRLRLWRPGLLDRLNSPVSRRHE